MPRLLLFNNVLLFFCCSLLLGAAAASLYFHVPLEPLPGFGSALSLLAIVMLVTGLAMALTEWFTGIRWVPVLVLLALAAWVALPMLSLPTADRERIRAALWAVQWLAMTCWFCRLAAEARADR
jgi:uncharacterized membrane protein